MKRTQTLLILLLSFSISFVSGCKDKESLVDTSANQLVDITSDEQFNAEVKEGVSMVFFHASWCATCASQRPAVESASVNTKYEAVFFAEVEYEDHKSLVKSRKIDGFPTVVIYKDNEEVKRFNGKGHSEEILTSALDAALN